VKSPQLNSLAPTYIRSLDGWRALAVLAVMALHDQAHHLGPLNDNWLNEHGVLGVRVFFAISGILICSRLLDEESRYGRISLRDFYVRRSSGLSSASATNSPATPSQAAPATSTLHHKPPPRSQIPLPIPCTISPPTAPPTPFIACL
jgi:hypothetical protein